jgi:hypothetical protein
MFSAISGLKTHQIKLDVTANDIANVNTIGYKGARTTFRDSLSQMQRGGAAAGGGGGGTNAAQIGLGVTLGSIDNQMQGGALQTTGNPLDLAIQGEGFFRDQTAPAGRRGRRVHPRGQLRHERRGRPRSPRRASSSSTPRATASRSPGGHERRRGPERLGHVHPAGRRRARHRGRDLHRHVPERLRPGAHRGQPLARGRELRRRGRRPAQRRQLRLDHRRRDRDVERRPLHDVHGHDHRPARLPGELPRHLDRPTRCCRTSVNLKR